MRLAFPLVAAVISSIILIDATNPGPHLFETNVSETDVDTSRLLRINDDNFDERAGPSVSGAKKLKSWLTSSKVTPVKLKNWLNKRKSADSVFRLMGLATTGSHLLFDRRFSAWLQYVEDLSKISNKKLSAISTLTSKYSDDALYKLIEKAKLTPQTESLATKLEAEHIQHWVAVRKDPDEVKYVDDLNDAGTSQVTSMIPTLRKHYSDRALFDMAESAKHVDETNSLATKLENALVQSWGSSRKAPKNALVELDLDTTTFGVLKNPMFNSWVKFVKAYDAKNPDKTMIETLTSQFGDDLVSKMLAAVKSEEVTQNMAVKLESAQPEMWRSNGKSVDDVFELLKLSRTKGDFSHNPLLTSWVSYMNTIVTATPNKMSTLFLELESRFTDRSLLQILETAMRFPSMEIAATKLHTEKIDDIFAKMGSPKEVFKQLSLDNVGGNVLSYPLFERWVEYVKVFNKENPSKQETWFGPLLREYKWRGVENKNRQGNAQSKHSGNGEKAGERAAYGLAQRKDASHSKFEVWAKYLDDFNERYPNDKVTMIDSLHTKYNYPWLLRMIQSAKQDPSTEKLASRIQNEMINKWVADKENPAHLEKLLYGTPTYEATLERYVHKLISLSETSP
ncbi:hypothetical protein GN958_ATG17482 [Phytophthora infestans]|uniref:Secreted RxLR effector peptide protein n=1 Tax=Phytophthora infestans TaxID=4787 RepID=A0A8S9TXB3_PHYIN|nr:hypothetical protein GN958_ATG17482 [Phytophthora infestans]